MNQKEKETLLEYMRSKHIMQVATCSGSLFDRKPWIATLTYCVDDNLNIYFLSDDTTQHCKDIQKNKHVACAIADSHQLAVENKKGIQLQGIATLVKNELDIKEILANWNKANPGLEHFITFINWKAGDLGDFYKITPTMIKLFDERLYGLEQKVFRP